MKGELFYFFSSRKIQEDRELLLIGKVFVVRLLLGSWDNRMNWFGDGVYTTMCSFLICIDASI